VAKPMLVRYMLHVQCPICPVTHPSGIVLTSSQPVEDESRSIADIYRSREMPPEISQLTSQVFKCPVTGRLFPQRDLAQVFLRRLN
jgi:hypothetical protein